MAGVLVAGNKGNVKSLLNSFKNMQITATRNKNHLRYPKLKNPVWFMKRTPAKNDDFLTLQSKSFIRSQVYEKFGRRVIKKGVQTYEKPVSLLNIEQFPTAEWRPGLRRTGVIAKKIGIYPLWDKNGKKISTTLLQIVDNHVIKYLPPGEFEPAQVPRVHDWRKWGCLLVGAYSSDPSNFTKSYCGLFSESGVMPKAVLHRFIISPEAALPPGTPLNINHFRVGDVIDVRGKTIDRGFQGVMKRWGFHGQPASHGQTKTHRRPGNIGAGGEKGRVWPGTKMPGHMGNRWRKLRGLEILRINTKYNVMWVTGQNLPGDTNSLCYIFDTMLPLRKPKTPLPFPTALETTEPEKEEYWHPDYQDFNEGTITFQSN